MVYLIIVDKLIRNDVQNQFDGVILLQIAKYFTNGKSKHRK